jgi:hypothetical protein
MDTDNLRSSISRLVKLISWKRRQVLVKVMKNASEKGIHTVAEGLGKTMNF